MQSGKRQRDPIVLLQFFQYPIYRISLNNSCPLINRLPQIIAPSDRNIKNNHLAPSNNRPTPTTIGNPLSIQVQVSSLLKDIGYIYHNHCLQNSLANRGKKKRNNYPQLLF